MLRRGPGQGACGAVDEVAAVDGRMGSLFGELRACGSTKLYGQSLCPRLRALSGRAVPTAAASYCLSCLQAKAAFEALPCNRFR